MYRNYSPALETDKFLKEVAWHANNFKRNNGFGKWIVEYQDMEAKGLFEPKLLKEEYIKILFDNSDLDFQRRQAVYCCCVCAHDAAEVYYNNVDNFLWQINVITGEIALDEDNDMYIGLSYEEAKQIADSLNEEAEEELFIIKRM